MLWGISISCGKLSTTFSYTSNWKGVFYILMERSGVLLTNPQQSVLMSNVHLSLSFFIFSRFGPVRIYFFLFLKIMWCDVVSLNCLLFGGLHHSLVLQMVIIELCAAISESQCSPSSEDTPVCSHHQYPLQSPTNSPPPGMGGHRTLHCPHHYTNCWLQSR